MPVSVRPTTLVPTLNFVQTQLMPVYNYISQYLPCSRASSRSISCIKMAVIPNSMTRKQHVMTMFRRIGNSTTEGSSSAGGADMVVDGVLRTRFGSRS